ncbi:MFS transporter [Streptomyces sp. VRA16 Mangrove soil]|uniref:MFS transporter n=1 Tax=Streptomyces sp. VRA16 Mangrove soil TaxID=2817434 RepID=UPI001A9F2257|nr:MFS transporter [Streptomyces sp. VRA16 Mangrove soil]MBO1332089.1 MFS transporter [Streptomyces sp. VRA16 Mangrove soil]
MSNVSAPLRARPTTVPGRVVTAGRAVGSRRHGVGFWAVALVFVVAMAFSTVPTPLYPLYETRDGFSTFMVTVVFAVYAVGVVISLLLAGHVSDWLGRKKILLPALGLELAAALLFLSSPDLPVLLVARFLTGLGVGMLSATATAHLHELHSAHRPGASGRRFERVSTAANIGGLGVGTLVSGLLAQYVHGPLRTPYAVFAVLLLVVMGVVALVPETVAAQPVRPRYRPQRVSADHGDRAGYIAAAAAAFASFAGLGVITSVATGFVGRTLHHPSHALAGVLVFAVYGAAALAQSLTDGIPARAKLTLGLLAEGAGFLLLAAGMHTLNLVVFVTGAVVAGVGAGLLFKAAVGSVVAMAAPARRGEALAGLFLIAYLGLSVPSVSVGVATLAVPPTTALTWYTGVLIVLLGAVALLGLRPCGRR